MTQNNNVLKKILKGIGIAMLIIVAVIGCLFLKRKIDTDREQREYERAEAAANEQAKQNIEKYINDKYGFIPEIEEVETKWIPDGDIFTTRIWETSGHISETTTALCNHDGKQFIVIVANTSDSVDDACDNYQEEEIIEAVHKRIEEITAQEIECYFVEYGTNDYQFLYYGVNKNDPYSRKCLVHNKFTGNNLGEIFDDQFQKENGNEITFLCSNVDLSDDILIDDDNDGAERLKLETVKEWFGTSSPGVTIYNVLSDDILQETVKEMTGEDKYKLNELFDRDDGKIKNMIFYREDIIKNHKTHSLK